MVFDERGTERSEMVDQDMVYSYETRKHLSSPGSPLWTSRSDLARCHCLLRHSYQSWLRHDWSSSKVPAAFSVILKPADPI